MYQLYVFDFIVQMLRKNASDIVERAETILLLTVIIKRDALEAYADFNSARWNCLGYGDRDRSVHQDSRGSKKRVSEMVLRKTLSNTSTRFLYLNNGCWVRGLRSCNNDVVSYTQLLESCLQGGGELSHHKWSSRES